MDRVTFLLEMIENFGYDQKVIMLVFTFLGVCGSTVFNFSLLYLLRWF